MNRRKFISAIIGAPAIVSSVNIKKVTAAPVVMPYSNQPYSAMRAGYLMTLDRYEFEAFFSTLEGGKLANFLRYKNFLSSPELKFVDPLRIRTPCDKVAP